MFTFFLRFKTRVTLVLAFLSLSAQSQSLHNFFEEKNDEKIQAWIKENPVGKVSVFNERLSVFYENRFPVSMLSCVAQEIHVLPLAILYENEKIVTELLRNPKIKSDSDLMSEAFKFAVAKNKLAWAKEIEKSCPELNKPSAYFFGKNALQIALSTPIDSDLLQFVIQSSSDEVFLHLDCFGKSVLHYMAEYNHIELYQDKNMILSQYFIVGDENLPFPIELAAANGHLEMVRLLWSDMKSHEDYQNYFNDMNIRRLNSKVLGSKNVALNSFVDSLVLKLKQLNRVDLMSFYLGEQPYDLNSFIDEALIYSDYFFDLTKMTENPMKANFLEFLKVYQKYKNEKIGVNTGIEPTFHGRSGLIFFDHLGYISSFFTNFFWNSYWTEFLSQKEMEELDEKQDPFFNFASFLMPPKYQNSFSIDHAELTGFQGYKLERLIFFLSELDIQYLRVNNVENLPTDYALFFPRLQYLELLYMESEDPVEAIVDLFYVKELKISGVDSLVFLRKPEVYKLERLHVSSETVIENLPKGVKVSYF